MATEKINGLSRSTVGHLLRLIQTQPSHQGRAAQSGGGLLSVIVRCTSDEPVGGDDIGNQSYPAVVLNPEGRTDVSDLGNFPEHGEVWLTLIGDEGPEVPVANHPYQVICSGYYTIGNATRTRVFAVPAGNGTGTGNGGVQDCGAFAGLHANLCLTAAVTNTGGICSGVGNQTLRLENSGSPDNWSANISLGIGDTTVHFHPGNAASRGSPLLWLANFTDGDENEIPETFLTLSDCGGGSLTFKGGYPICPIGEEDTPTCPPSTFSVTIDCGDCPNANYAGPGWYCVGRDGTCGNTATQTAANYTTDPGVGVLLCSGPYANQTAAHAVCPPSDPVEASCCIGNATIPSVLFGTFTEATGSNSCLLGVAVTLIHTTVSGNDVWYGTVGDCSGAFGTCIDVSLYCHTGGSGQMILKLRCGTPCSGAEATGDTVGATSFTTDPFAITLDGSTPSGVCGPGGVPGTFTLEVTE